jgi:hypothetical protein
MPTLSSGSSTTFALPAGHVAQFFGTGMVQLVPPVPAYLPRDPIPLVGGRPLNVGPFNVPVTLSVVAVGAPVEYWAELPATPPPSGGESGYVVRLPNIAALAALAASARLDPAAVYIDTATGAKFLARSATQYGLADPVFYSNGVVQNAPADTAENTLDSILIPGGLMGPNSVLRITAQVLVTDSAGTKTFWFRLGGVNIMATIFGAGNASASYTQLFFNRGSVSANGYQNGNTAGGPSNAAMIDTSINTGIDQVLSFVAQKSVAGDTISKRMFMVEVLG